jgi:hypothetical protein
MRHKMQYFEALGCVWTHPACPAHMLMKSMNRRLAKLCYLPGCDLKEEISNNNEN